MSRNCRLCGGRLSGGICTECGLDNRKSDEMYQDILNKSPCDGEKLTHIHETDDKEKRKNTYKEQVRQLGAGIPYTGNKTKRTGNAQKKSAVPPRQSMGGSKRKVENYTPTQFYTGRTGYQNFGQKKGTTVFIVLVLIFLLVFLIAVGVIKHNSEKSFQQQMEYLENFDDYDFDFDYDFGEDLENYVYDPYGNAKDTLKETGEYWSQQMEPGMYQVGVDIPEGEYRVSGSRGSSFEVHDAANFITDIVRFGEEEDMGEVNAAEGVKLFAGALICVDGMNPVNLVSENAQTQELQARITNPLTETVEVTGTLTAGKDFPAGTYDIKAKTDGEYGIVFYHTSAQDGEEYAPSFSVMMEANPTEEYPEYCSLYKNVVLPEGTVVETEELTVELVPSQGIISEDYLSFYSNM